MFSGIIQHKAKILDIDSGRFTVENKFQESLKIGQSIAHDGACMTLETIKDSHYSFFVMQESFSKTNFSEKKVGDFFNVEPCISYNERIDGHFVSGHIDSKGSVSNIQIVEDGSKIITIAFDKEFKNNIIEKGSIAVNGASLTAYNVTDEHFDISLIPLTQEITNLGSLQTGDSLNLEFDMIGKFILKSRNEA